MLQRSYYFENLKKLSLKFIYDYENSVCEEKEELRKKSLGYSQEKIGFKAKNMSNDIKDQQKIGMEQPGKADVGFDSLRKNVMGDFNEGDQNVGHFSGNQRAFEYNYKCLNLEIERQLYLEPYDTTEDGIEDIKQYKEIVTETILAAMIAPLYPLVYLWT